MEDIIELTNNLAATGTSFEFWERRTAPKRNVTLILLNPPPPVIEMNLPQYGSRKDVRCMEAIISQKETVSFCKHNSPIFNALLYFSFNDRRI